MSKQRYLRACFMVTRLRLHSGCLLPLSKSEWQKHPAPLSLSQRWEVTCQSWICWSARSVVTVLRKDTEIVNTVTFSNGVINMTSVVVSVISQTPLHWENTHSFHICHFVSPLLVLLPVGIARSSFVLIRLFNKIVPNHEKWNQIQKHKKQTNA